jgi:hypothetical protein
VPDDLPVHVTAQGPEHPFHSRIAKVADFAATDAHGVVVVTNARCAVLWRPVRHSQFAQGAGINQQLHSPINGRPPDVRHRSRQVFRRKCFVLGLDGHRNPAPGRRDAHAVVFKRRKKIVLRG